MKKQTVTISDVAEAAGVSKTTISRYINGRMDLIGKKTQQRIASVIELSNYRPNYSARSLKNKKSMFIGVVIADASSPYSSALVNSISNTLTQEGYIPLFTATNNSYEREMDTLSFLLSRAVDGVIVNTSSAENPMLIGVATEGVPVVLCDREVRDYRFESVVVDNMKIMESIVAHLYSEGYSDVILVSQSNWESISSRVQRHAGYKAAMREYYGVADFDERICVIDPECDRLADTLKKLTASSRERTGGVPAFVAVNNVITMLLLNAIRKAGFHMPNEIGLCGCDDWGWNDRMNWAFIPEPAITTFSFDTYEVGRQCALSILNRIREPRSEKRFICLPCELNPRGSTALRSGKA